MAHAEEFQSGMAPVLAAETPQVEKTESDATAEGRKLFVGGLDWSTTNESLNAYFSKFGTVESCNVMTNPQTQRSRGFGFVTFTDKDAVDRVVAVEPHELDGRKIDPKLAVPRPSGWKSGEAPRVKKIFVGGLPPSADEAVLTSFFQDFGNVVEVNIQVDRHTGRPRGFGFITFDSEDTVEKLVTQNHYVDIQGKQVEIKRATPRHNQNGPRRGGYGHKGPFRGGNPQMSYGYNMPPYGYRPPQYGGYPPYGAPYYDGGYNPQYPGYDAAPQMKGGKGPGYPEQGGYDQFQGQFGYDAQQSMGMPPHMAPGQPMPMMGGRGEYDGGHDQGMGHQSYSAF